jgi:chromosome partitioning protein
MMSVGSGPELPQPTGRAALRLACVSGKGGVGKTTTAISLAAAFGELGLTALAIDCDPQSNMTSGLGVEPDELTASVSDVMSGRLGAFEAILPTEWRGVWLLPATPELTAVEARLPSALGRELALREALRAAGVANRFDVILFDSPPNFGIHTVNVLAATQYIIVPLQMSGFAVKGLKEVLRVIAAARRDLNPELELLGLVPTFVNLRTRMSRDMLAAICEVSGIRVFDARIPETVKVQESSLLGVPITEHARSSRAADGYRSLASDILEALNETPTADSSVAPPLWLSVEGEGRR